LSIRGVALTLGVAGIGLAIVAPTRLAAVVISEINYNPKPGDEELEFVELANEFSTPEDLSGYVFTNGISFVFPPHTILAGNGFIVVAAHADALKARYGITNVVGDFTGKLDASGERLTLSNHAGLELQDVRYRDRGKWPAEPDGTGHTLSLRNPHLEASEPESWVASAELGGTPGVANFEGTGPRYEEQVLIARGAQWRYAKGTQDFSVPATAWRELTFNDSSWLTGASSFGYGDDDDATVLSDMPGGYLSVAIRKKFTLSQADLDAAGDFYLGIDYDDGFCAFVNGQEIVRVNCGNPGEVLPWNATATGSREAGSEEVYPIPRSYITAGDNILAVVGHNFSPDSSDFTLAPRLLHRREITTQGATPLSIAFNELYRGAAAGQGWVELYNADSASADLSGFQVTDLPGKPDPLVLPPGSVVPAHGFLVINESAGSLLLTTPEVHLFLIDLDGRAVAATVFDRAGPTGLADGTWAEAAYPDGARPEWVTDTPTRGAPNAVPRTRDVVINEIFYHPPERVDPDIPTEERFLGEFLELYNRGGSAIDVSGFRFDKGIDYTIPDGVVIPAGGYLVIAEDPALIQARYGYAGALGPYEGHLANDGENIRLEDRWGNLVNEVRYAEGNLWSEWADGGGASLELIDPDQDNSLGTAWDASDESAKTEWEQLSFQVPSYAAAGESELHLYLVQRGICYVDDVVVQRVGTATNLIPNPGFESSTTGWIIEGTHVRSRRTTSDKHSGGACLELNASGKGDTLVNRVEIETSTAMVQGAKYQVSLWARWARGSSVVICHGDYTAGAYGGRPSPATNLSGNSVSAALRMTVPLNLGTPGAENSVRQVLRDSTGSDNLGPVIGDVQHRPLSPAAGQPVTVTCRISDADGVASAAVNYRLGSGAGTFAAVPLADDGAHGDSAAGDGVFGGELPAAAAQQLVVFYVEAQDGAGQSRRLPLTAPASTFVYQAQGSAGPGIDAARMVLDTARRTELDNRTLHSNDLVEGSFVFNDSEVYYNVGVRYRGSPWGRPGRNSYRVKFPEDRPFLRGRKAMNLDNSGGGPGEGACYYLILRNNSPSTPTPSCDYGYVRTFLNGENRGTHGLLQPVDRQFVNDWYGDADNAVVYKVEGRRMFTDGGTLAAWDGASFIHRGYVAENYRDYFIQGLRRSVDPWEEWFRLTEVMDTRTASNAVFDQNIDTVLNVEEFLRVLAPRILQADWDAYCVGNGHNGYMVYSPLEARWSYLGFDMDNVFGSTAPGLFPTADPYVARLMQRPALKRLYFRILWEYIAGAWSSAGSGPYFDAVQRDTGVGMSGLKGTLDAVANVVRSQVQSSTTTAFKIVTNSGNPITTDQLTVQLQGDAPVTIDSIQYVINGGDPTVLEPVWTSPTRWQASFQLAEAQNEIELLGFDGAGQLSRSTSIIVNSTAHPSGPVITGVYPVTGTPYGGTIVTFTGSGFDANLRVLFGGREAQSVTILQADVAQAVVPTAVFPLPADGKVDIELRVGTGSTMLPGGFTYVLEEGFVRGDATNDASVDLADSVALLFHLFQGLPLLCLDAADANDDGSVNLTDVVFGLDYLFRAGASPPRPFPGPGPDPTADSLPCPQ